MPAQNTLLGRSMIAQSKRQTMAFVYGESKYQDEWEVLAVFLSTTNLPSQRHWARPFHRTVVVFITITVPTAPLTSLVLVLIFLTCVPTAISSIALRQPVRLQSTLTFSITCVAFSVCVNMPRVSSTSSVHGIFFVPTFNLDGMSMLNFWQASCVAEKPLVCRQ